MGPEPVHTETMMMTVGQPTASDYASGAPETGKVTVSIGGTCVVPLEGRSASGALQLADQNLYAAKRLGRNRVVFHSDEYAMMQTGSFRHGAAGP